MKKEKKQWPPERVFVIHSVKRSARGWIQLADKPPPFLGADWAATEYRLVRKRKPVKKASITGGINDSSLERFGAHGRKAGKKAARRG